MYLTWFGVFGFQWSFGVLLWELVTRGATPYPGIENWALSRHIQQGGRMKQPLYCPNSVYVLHGLLFWYTCHGQYNVPKTNQKNKNIKFVATENKR